MYCFSQRITFTRIALILFVINKCIFVLFTFYIFLQKLENIRTAKICCSIFTDSLNAMQQSLRSVCDPQPHPSFFFKVENFTSVEAFRYMFERLCTEYFLQINFVLGEIIAKLSDLLW